MTSDEHKAVIEQQKKIADEAGKAIAAELVKKVPVRRLIAVAIVNKANRVQEAGQLSRTLVLEYIKLIDKPVNETHAIAEAFAEEKMKNVEV